MPFAGCGVVAHHNASLTFPSSAREQGVIITLPLAALQYRKAASGHSLCHFFQAIAVNFEYDAGALHHTTRLWSFAQ
jgi:hypothetical protein